jgi:gliding motility-associated-like protein
MRVKVICIALSCISHLCIAQLTSSGCAGESSYTDGQPNDVVYFFPPSVNGDLTATPAVSGNSFTFKWYRFIPGTNAWALYQTVNNAPTSTLTNLIPAAYQVVITQGSNTVGCYRAWIAQILVEPEVSIEPIAPGCSGPILLQGNYTPGQMTAMSNLPDAQLLINANTQISVCFSGIHSWISDLAFYIKGPSTCGSPTILLSPNPGAIGQNAICNNSNNINNLCFSNASNNNLNVCNGMNGLSGTYGSYGPAATPINWAGLYGCDAMNGGWTVQIYDCIGGDVGVLTDATITFNGTDICGNVQSTTYSTPNGYNSPINDNSCSPNTASSYAVAPAVPPALLNCTFGYEWTSNPPVQIPNATSSLNITLNTLTSPNGTVLPWQDVEFTLTETTACTDVSIESECWGGNMSATQIAQQEELIQAEITGPSSLCSDNNAINLMGNPTGGTWSGSGITNETTGSFDPGLAILGSNDVTYSFDEFCILADQLNITVHPDPVIIHTSDTTICANAPTPLYAGGAQNYQWSPANLFDNPNSAGPIININSQQSVTLSAISAFGCQTDETIALDVFSPPVIAVDDASMICQGDEVTILANTSAGSLVWLDETGNIVSNDNPLIQTLFNSATFIAQLTDQCDIVASAAAQIPVESGYSITTDGNIEICEGEIATLTAISGTNAFDNLVWTTTDGIIVGNENSNTITTGSSGAYTATGTSVLGCIYSDFTNVIVHELPDVSAGNDLTLCAGIATTVSASGALEYQWSPAELLENANTAITTVTATTNGTLTLTGTDENGCSAQDLLEFNVLDSPVITTEIPDSICPGESITLSATGNYSDITWEDALGNVLSNNFNFSVNPEVTSTYTAVLNSDCNVEATSAVTVPVETLYIINLLDAVNLCTGSSIQMDGNISPDNAQIQWATNDGVIQSSANNEIITVSSGGTYEVSLVTPLGCTYNDAVAVNEIPNPNISVTPDTTVCAATPFSLFASGANEYNWTTTGEMDNAVTNTPIITLVTNGIATLIGTDNNGCSDTAVINLNVFPNPSLAIIPVGEICPNEIITLQAVTSDGQYEWTDASGNILGDQPNVTVAPSANSNYSFTISDACGIVLTAEISVPVESGYGVNLGPTAGVCNNVPISIDANGTGVAALYEWSTNNGLINSSTSLETITAAAPGNYYVNQTSPMGCLYTDSIELTQFPEPIISVGNDANVCYNQPFALSASGGISYTWSPTDNLSNSNMSNPQVTLINDATYYLTGTDANGCVGIDTIHLTVNPLPVISIDPVQMICPGSSVNLLATANYSDISWTPNIGLSATTGNTVQATPSATTNYTALLTDDNCGLTAETSVLVQVESNISITVGGDQSFCEGDTVIIPAVISGEYTDFHWTSISGASFTPAGATSMVTGETGTFAADITSPLGCIYSDELDVTEIQYPDVNLEDSIAFCPGDSASIIILAGFENIYWSNGDNTAETSIASEGLYTVDVLNGNCATIDTFYVYEVEFPFFNLGSDREICEGDSVSISAGIPGEWSVGGNSSYITVNQEGDYTFTIERLGCYMSDEVHVEVVELPDYQFYSPQYACIGENHILQPSGVNATYFEWEGGQMGETLSVDVPGNYYVIASNECGSTIAEVDVIFQDCEGLLFIPNCFTPDGDGINDEWIVVGSDIKGMELKIYNRWGDAVYHSQEINPVWTGGMDGGDYYLPDGIYFFDIEVVLAKGQTIRRRGNFRMLR